MFVPAARTMDTMVIKKDLPLLSAAEANASAQDHSSTLPIVALLLTALVVRLLALVSLLGTGYAGVLVTDELVYHQWASDLAAGTVQSTSVYGFSPLPAYVIATLYKLFGPDPVYTRLLNVLLGVATCFVIYRVGFHLGDRRIGLIAGFLAAFCEPFILYSVVPLKSALAVFLFSLTLLCVVRLLKTSSGRSALLTGLAAGLLAATRENTLALLPLMLGLTLYASWRVGGSMRQPIRIAASLLAGYLLVLAPFALRNYLVAGELALTTHQAGFNLYIGNNPANPTPYFQPAPFASALPSEAETHYRIEASRRTGRMLSYQEAERFWIGTVVAYAREHPSDFLAKIGQRALALFNRFEAGDHYDWTVLGESALFFQIPFLGFFLLAPLGLAGMVWHADRDMGRWSLMLLGGLYASTLLWFPMIGRYRLPLLVILIIFASFTLAKLYDAWQDWSWPSVVGPGVTTLLCLGLVSIPIEGSQDRSGHYNIQAWMLMQQGKLEDAAAIWRFSSGLNGAYSVYANLSLARMALQQQDADSARLYLDKIPDSSFGAAAKYEVLGDLFALTQQPQEAMAAYRRSLEINAGNLSPRKKLLALLSQFDPEQAREEGRRLDEMASFYADLHHPRPGPSPSLQKRSALVR